MRKLACGLVLSGVLVLSACGGNEEAAKPTDEPKVEEKKEKEEEVSQAETEKEAKKNEESNEEDKPVSETDTGEKYEEGFGHMKVIGVAYSDELGIDGTDAPVKPITMGDMNLFINGGGIMDIELDEEMKPMFDDQDKVRAIVVDMKAENTSDKDITFNPNQAIIVTDTGEQLESEMMFMGDAGGDFLGKVTKEGQTWWLVKNFDKDIKKLTMVVSPPFATDSWDDAGEEKRLTFDVLTWEESKKKDSQ
ncbi:hypothetical protein SLL00_03405 [Metabacillus indicus]|uniref:hypothetical protein n=1 Tax=Metabacillus indicus TaxID=246786 RepID=UPI002A0903D6|nr:hypothetical protein [Metabacillus indicus]MDX8288820.1 hypothetical protein [Metabacillus indicus]